MRERKERERENEIHPTYLQWRHIEVSGDTKISVVYDTERARERERETQAQRREKYRE
jgi:hypothetical protein